MNQYELNKNILCYPDTVILKLKRIGYCNYILTVFGILGSISTKITPKLVVNINKNTLCLIYNKSISNRITSAFSEIIRLNATLLTLHLGYWTTLKIIGVGYKVQKSVITVEPLLACTKQYLFMYLGYSHPISCVIPNNIDVFVNKKTLKMWSSSFNLLRNFSYKLLFIKKKIDNYKCKGLIPSGFLKKLKVGKVSRV